MEYFNDYDCMSFYHRVHDALIHTRNIRRNVSRRNIS